MPPGLFRFGSPVPNIICSSKIMRIQRVEACRARFQFYCRSQMLTIVQIQLTHFMFEQRSKHSVGFKEPPDFDLLFLDTLLHVTLKNLKKWVLSRAGCTSGMRVARKHHFEVDLCNESLLENHRFSWFLASELSIESDAFAGKLYSSHYEHIWCQNECRNDSKTHQ